jgi:aldehyde dehydrogenase (NAD+)
MIDRIEAGTIWINNYRPFSFMLPVTGFKQSGLGSENGQANLLSFLKAKSVYINHGGPVMVPFLED